MELALGARLVLGAVLLVAGAAKLVDRVGSIRALEEFGVPARVSPTGAWVLPLAELAVAVGLAVPATAWAAAVAATTLLLVFAAAITLSLIRGRAPECHCLGQLHSASASWSMVARNILLAGAAVLVIARGPAVAQPSPVRWVGSLRPAELVLVCVAIGLALVVLAQAWFLSGLFNQNGRILNRLERLEGAIGLGPTDPGVLASAQPNGTRHQAGLPIGVPAPGFELPTIDSDPTSLRELLGRGLPTLLVFSDPKCGPCTAMLPKIARWQRDEASRLTIALIGRGGVAENSAKAGEHELRDVLVQSDREVSHAYAARGTPSAVVVSPDGLIATKFATGAAEIAELVAAGQRELFRVIPAGPGSTEVTSDLGAGLSVGEHARDLGWIDLDNRGLALADFSGRTVALVFWNPHCGFCERLLPDLKALELGFAGATPPVVVISTGSSDDNWVLGLRSRIVSEPGFETGRMIGATGTPAAVLVGPDGRVRTRVAMGGSAVIELLGRLPRLPVAPVLTRDELIRRGGAGAVSGTGL